MIDIENLVYSKTSQAVRTQFGTQYPTLKTYSTTPQIPEAFPCVVIEMIGNASDRRTFEFGKATENHANLTFQLDVYANNGDQRKQTAKEIFDFTDTFLQSIGFVRTLASPTPNIDCTVFRITGRYTGVSDAGIKTTVDGKTVYHFTIFK